MQYVLVTRGKAIQIVRDELAREGVRPTQRTIDLAFATVKAGGLLLHTGAKLNFVANSRRYWVYGYAHDGSDVQPFRDSRAVALRSEQASFLPYTKTEDK